MGQVVAYENKPPYRMYCQLRLDSGERILISITDSGIRISKLGFGGRIRTSTIWQCERDDIRDTLELFADSRKPMTSALDAIKDKLVDFQSIGDIKAFLSFPPARPETTMGQGDEMSQLDET